MRKTTFGEAPMGALLAVSRGPNQPPIIGQKTHGTISQMIAGQPVVSWVVQHEPSRGPGIDGRIIMGTTVIHAIPLSPEAPVVVLVESLDEAIEMLR